MSFIIKNLNKSIDCPGFDTNFVAKEKPESSENLYDFRNSRPIVEEKVKLLKSNYAFNATIHRLRKIWNDLSNKDRE